MKKIFALSVGRSDYDRYYPILKELNNSSQVNLYLILAKAHYSSKFGKTVSYLDKKFKIIKNKKKITYLDKPSQIIKNYSDDLVFLSKKIEELKPDILLVLGDRYEMLIGPTAAAPYNIPVIHFFGGAVTEGATDELFRHAITKMSHLHFVALNDYKKRLYQMGEEKWRVKNIGLHELKYLKKISTKSKKSLSNLLNFNFKIPYALFTFHPVTIEPRELKKQFYSIAQALKKTNLNVVITYPNADLGHEQIIKIIDNNFKNKKKYKIIKNCGAELYANLMKHCEVVIGNSSSGIVEATTFNKPAVNIGSRQKGKFMPPNVINSKNSKNEILKKINIALSNKFYKKIKNIKNPYESTIGIKALIKLMLNIKVNDKLIRKKFINKI